MKKIVLLILSLVILMQTISFASFSLTELSNLWEHYSFHERQYKDSFASFISKHYGDLKKSHSKQQQNEHSEHQKLPFHSFQSTSLALLGIFRPEEHTLSESTFDPLTNHEFHYSTSYSLVTTKSHLRPPISIV